MIIIISGRKQPGRAHLRANYLHLPPVADDEPTREGGREAPIRGRDGTGSKINKWSV